MEQVLIDIYENVKLQLPHFVIAFIIVTLFFIMRSWIVKLILALINRLMIGIKEDTRKTIRDAFEKPLRVMVVIVGLYIAVLNLPYDLQSDSLMARCLKTVFIITFAYGMYYMDHVITIAMSKFRRKIQFEASEVLKKFTLRIYHVVVVLVAITMAADQFGINVNSIIAGLGIAGLAVALAAQDTLANVFGGITVIFDKPFDVGDLIRTGNIEGFVEDISFRTTKLRTLTKEMVTIPNSAIANGAILNFTQRDQRRIKMVLGATYNTTRQEIQSVIRDLTDMLIALKGVDTDSVYVRFDGFGPSSKDIYISFMVLTADWGEYLIIKEEACYGMMDVFEKHAVDFAFPSQSVYFENPIKMEKTRI